MRARIRARGKSTLATVLLLGGFASQTYHDAMQPVLPGTATFHKIIDAAENPVARLHQRHHRRRRCRRPTDLPAAPGGRQRLSSAMGRSGPPPPYFPATGTFISFFFQNGVMLAVPELAYRCRAACRYPT